MHEQDMVHLDVKEPNVLVQWDGQAGRYIGMVRGGAGGKGIASRQTRLSKQLSKASVAAGEVQVLRGTVLSVLR